MSKFKFTVTNRQRFMHQKTQQPPFQLASTRRNSERHRDLLMPIQQFPRKGFPAGKPIKSEGKPNDREQRHPAIELLNLKQSLLLRRQGDSMPLRGPPRRKLNSNRLLTEKVGLNSASVEKKQSSVNKILIRGGGFSKQLSPERQALKQEPDRVWVSQKPEKHYNRSVQKSPDGADSKRVFDRKLTPFQKQESAGFEIFYVGTRRIYGRSDFTDGEGDPKVAIGDSIAYKYEIITQLGQGSFGRVFKAFDHRKKQMVALKIIKCQQKFTAQARVQVQILETALLHDPKLRCNIVRLKGSFIFRGHSCLKFEVLHKNLYEFLKESQFSGFSLDLIRRFAIQILQALFFLRQHHIVHCDLKPENILLKQQNKSGLKVIDMGSGCFQDKQIYTYIQSRFYRAPEIILGIKYTSAIDMWSFGCILVQLYTGVPLFPGQNQNQQILMFFELLGEPPREMLELAERRKKFFNDNFECKIPQQKGKQKNPNSLTWREVLGQCDPLFVQLVRGCFEWDPLARLTPKKALLHPWIVEGLPEVIRKQHVEQIKAEPDFFN